MVIAEDGEDAGIGMMRGKTLRRQARREARMRFSSGLSVCYHLVKEDCPCFATEVGAGLDIDKVEVGTPRRPGVVSLTDTA